MSDQPVLDANAEPKEDNTDNNITKIRRFFSAVTILLVIIAQILLFTSKVDENLGMPVTCPENSFPLPFVCDQATLMIYIAITLLIIGVVFFVLTQLAFGPKYKPPHFLQTFLNRFQSPQATPWVMASLVLSLLAMMAMLLFEKAKLTNYIPVVTIWFFAAMCYVGGFVKDQFSFPKLREWLQLHRNELIGIGLVTLFAAVLRFYKLGEIPRVVNGDEGRAGMAALSTIGYPYVNPFSLWENFGGLYLQTINLILSFLGTTPFALRLVAAIAGTLAIPTVYLLARQISGHRVALIAAAFIAMSHSHLHFSRTVAVAYIQGDWLIPLEFYLLLSGITKKSSWRVALSGMLLALHYSIYLDAQIVTALILVYMVIAFFMARSWLKPALRQVAVFWGGFLIMFLPELAFILEHPTDFFDRLNKDGMFQSGWLDSQVTNIIESTHVQAPPFFITIQILAQRVLHVFLSLFYYPAFDFYGVFVPILSIISAVLFMLGLGLVLWKTRSPGFLLLNGHFWAGVLSIAIFSLPPSADTYRLLIVLPTVFIIAAVGLDYMLDVLGLGWEKARKAYITLAAAILLSQLAFNLWTYSVDFAGQCRYGNDDGPTRFASYLGNYARGVDMGSEIYLLSDNIYMTGTHQSVDFLSHKRNITNVPEPMETVQFSPGSVVVASPDRTPELQAWARAHPEGKVHTEYDCGYLMLYSYQFP